MYTIYWEKGSGVIVVQAMLEEISAQYQKHHVNMMDNEHRSAEYLSKNPTGLVPALGLTDGRVIGESAAITLYLADRYSKSGLVPSIDDAERPEFLFWLFYMASTGYTTSSRLWHPEQFTQQNSDIDSIRQVAEADTAHLFDILERNIKGKPYFLSSGFSALDLYLAMLLEWHPEREVLFQHSVKLAALYATVKKRSAYQRTMADHS